MTDPILGFQGQYRFLSNFYQFEWYYWGNNKFPTAEHAYQYQKSRMVRAPGKKSIEILEASTPGIAKRLGGRIPITKAWPFESSWVMLEILRRKFSHPGLRKLLLATENRELIEVNNWHDNRWGICSCGECRVANHPTQGNLLGSLLMVVRGEIQEEIEELG